jgi:hypothetical protein
LGPEGKIMCKQGTTKKLTVADMRFGISSADIDACIYDLVKALNDGGIPTDASCCGHGRTVGIISLRDGRELIVTDYEMAMDIGRRYRREVEDENNKT